MRISDWSSDVCSSDLLVGSLSYLEQRVVAGRARVGRVEQQAVREALSPAGRELPVLALDVVDDGGTGPGQQRRDHEATALARARRREAHDALRAITAQVVALHPSEAPDARTEPRGPT